MPKPTLYVSEAVLTAAMDPMSLVGVALVRVQMVETEMHL